MIRDDHTVQTFIELSRNIIFKAVCIHTFYRCDLLEIQPKHLLIIADHTYLRGRWPIRIDQTAVINAAAMELFDHTFTVMVIPDKT